MTVQWAPRSSSLPSPPGRNHGFARSCAEDSRWPALLPTLEAGNWPAPPSSGIAVLARCPLTSDFGSPRIAREFTRTTLEGWDAAELFDEAGVVVSELVTNALRYGLPGRHRNSRAPVQLVLLRQERRILALVTDPNSDGPVQGDPDEFAETGRGLQVVDAITESWGWAPLATGGKAVWAAFAL
jgi:hypothetical protein